MIVTRRMGGRRLRVAARSSLAARSIKAEVVTVKTRDAGLHLLDQRKVDGLASDRIVLIGMIMRTPAQGVFKLLDEDFSIEPYAFALPRGDADYRLAVNRVLARLYRTGEINTIYSQWLGRIGPPSLLLSAAFFIQSISE